MTYKESYMRFNTLEELQKEVNIDIVIAKTINADRIPIIKKAFEDVVNLKFNN